MSEEGNVDYIPIVRAMVKMSSALNDADTVMYGRYFKFDFKKKFKRWVEVFERISNPMMGSFMENSEEALQQAYDRFLEYSKDIKVKDEDRTALILLYCKLKSSMNDLEDMDYTDGGLLVAAINMQTFKVVKAIENQYSDIFDVRDSDGKSIQTIIDHYDELGNTMFTKK